MIRHALYAGSWYPADAKDLQALVAQSIEEARKRATYQRGPYRFAVLPHAGLFYSKAGIAPFFTASYPDLERILILSPSHYANLKSDILASAPLSGCQTPLGVLEGFNLSSAQDKYFSAIQSEHALEMVLPFIASMPDRPKVGLALISRFSDPDHIHAIADQLVADLGEENLRLGKTVVIASSDFTHYGPRFGYTPYQDGAPKKVREDDLALSHLLCDGRVNEAYAFCASHHSTVCGYAPSLVVSDLAQRLQCTGWVADYYTSQDVSSSEDANFVAYSTILWR
ncbi:MAG: AmmeMemoRadiSam system protein B [Sphaerochaeta sp.]|nr:AmmeMemoRadiSam system protein B [Sphaerochaeta sp.]NCC12955.1 AmmeMemoRadiSam system protein B [Spirochaetia bacterium]NCC89441.1 AmmeMemoRadiSam system protein B [Spirochaetia bacterium]